jgi:hypothetical protein
VNPVDEINLTCALSHEHITYLASNHVSKDVVSSESDSYHKTSGVQEILPHASSSSDPAAMPALLWASGRPTEAVQELVARCTSSGLLHAQYTLSSDTVAAGLGTMQTAASGVEVPEASSGAAVMDFILRHGLVQLSGK